MELTERTLKVLGNFANINGNIYISEGNVLRTVSESKTVLGKSTIDIDFPKSFGIYDLREFMSVMNLLDSPSLNFEDEFVSLSDASGRSKIKYYYSAPETLTVAKQDIALPSVNAWFTLDSTTLSKIKSASAALGHSEVTVTLEGSLVTLTVTDNADDTAHEFEIVVEGETDHPDMKVVFNINNLKLIEDGNYRVDMSSQFISHFVNTESNTEYWVALQKSSTF
jgi:hypothetical protein